MSPSIIVESSSYGGDSLPERYLYSPKQDITVYELALLVPYLIKDSISSGSDFYKAGRTIGALVYEQVPSDLRRHFSP